MTRTDDDLRRALAPIAEHRPSPEQHAALRRRFHKGPTRRRRRLLRPALAFAVALAAVTAGSALWPADEEREAAPEILASAAATAAEERAPTVTEAPLRYTRVRSSFRYHLQDGARSADITLANLQESWVGGRWRGELLTSDATRRVTGDEDLAGDGSPLPTGRQAFAYGDGPLARLDPSELPARRDAIGRVLMDGIRNDRWGPYSESRGRPSGLPEAVVRSQAAYSAILLLVYARLTPEQRAALLDVLASAGEARDLGTVADAEGRTGRGVELTFPGDDIVPAAKGATPSATPARTYRLVIDQHRAEILQWTDTPPGGPTKMSPERREVVLATGYAHRSGQRP